MVAEVLDTSVTMHLPGGLRGVVDAAEVSDFVSEQYRRSIKAAHGKKNGSDDADDDSEESSEDFSGDNSSSSSDDSDDDIDVSWCYVQLSYLMLFGRNCPCCANLCAWVR